MLNSESSLRIKLLRFPLILGVIFIHNYEPSVGFADQTIGTSENNFLSEFVRNLISQGIARTAVPIFFLMSGYLFFAGFTWSIGNYIDKLRSRIRTLLIPFLFWNIVTLLLIASAQALPATQIYMSGKNVLIASFSHVDYLNAIFGIGRPPISYQLWYVRDLMLLILMVPLFAILNKILLLPWVMFLLVCWFLNTWPIFAPSAEATLFFALGCFLASIRKSLFALDKYGKIIGLVYVIVVVTDVMSIDMDLNSHLHKFGILLGVITMLFMTKFLLNSEKLKQATLALGSASFFVYAAHEPLLSVMRKVAYQIIQPESSYLTLVLYFTIPILVSILLIMAYRFLSTYFSTITQVITGGR